MEIGQQMLDTLTKNRCEYSFNGERCDKPTTQNSYFCTEHTNDPGIDLEVYKSISARLRHYSDSLWARSNFYLLVQAGLFTVFAGVLASTASRAPKYFILIDFAIGLLGLSQACLWYIATKITVKFLNYWRGQMVKIDKAIDKRQHHTEVETQAMTTLTPAQLILWMCTAFIIGWIALIGVLFGTILV